VARLLVARRLDYFSIEQKERKSCRLQRRA
jgi:hypothetical protein